MEITQHQPQQNPNLLQQNPNVAQSITLSERTPTSVKHVLGNVSNMLISTHDNESNATAHAYNTRLKTMEEAGKKCPKVKKMTTAEKYWENLERMAEAKEMAKAEKKFAKLKKMAMSEKNDGS